MTVHGNRITRVARSADAEPGEESRLIAVRVVDLTRDLVSLVGRRRWPEVARVLVERRALLERIPQRPGGADEAASLAALRAAMAESDRTVGLLLASADLRWPDGAGIGG